MIGGVQLANTRTPLPIKRRMISLKGMMLPMSQVLGFFTINASLHLKIVNNRIPLAITEFIINVCSARRQNTTIAGTIITLDRSVIYLTLKIPRTILKDV